MRYAMAATSITPPISPDQSSPEVSSAVGAKGRGVSRSKPLQRGCGSVPRWPSRWGWVCKPTPWAGSVGWIYRYNPLLMIFVHLHTRCAWGLKCIDCRYFWNPFFVMWLVGTSPPINDQAPSMAGKRAKPVPGPSSMPWKRLPRQPSSLLLLAPLASLLWVTGLVVCHNNRDLVVIVKTRTCRAFGEDSIPPRF